MQFSILILVMLFPFAAFTRNGEPARYKDLIFEKVSVDKNLSYLQGATDKSHLFDLYQPEGDKATLRPLILWLHGGGFKFGKKTSRGIPGWSKSFAQRGYVCAALNYRLTKKKALSQFPALADGCYDAIEDVSEAVKFFKMHATEYRIDTNLIILGGNSAGGIIALQACYSNLEQLAKIAGRADSNEVSKAYNPLHIAGIINMWGAIFNTAWLSNANVPIVSVHGSKDRVVAITTKNNTMFGSESIHEAADKLKIANRIKIYQGYGHELQKHFIPFYAGCPVKKRWKEAGQFAADFLYDTIFK